MKRVLTVLLMLAVAASLFAGGVENKNNMSAGYMRNPSKNTETTKPDAVFYNPAGTAYMEEGLYVELGNQFVFKDYTNDTTDAALIDNEEFSATDPILLYPNGEIVWNAGNFALFGGLSVVAGGGKAEFDDGSYTSTAALYLAGAPLRGQAHSLDATAIMMGEVIGGSYAVNEYVSLSAAARFVQGKITQKITLDSDPGIGTTDLADTEATAKGIGGIFGIHVNATDKLDLALQYQSIVKLEYEYDSVDGFGAFLTGMQVAEGDKYDKDIPAVLSAGIGYQLLDNLYTSLSFNYYFNESASFETGVQDGETEYTNSWEIGAGADYALSDMITLSGGLLYSKQGFDDDENSAEVPILDSITIGVGSELTFIEDLKIDIGILKPIYFESDYETGFGDVTLSKKLLMIGIGATYKLF